MALVKIVILAGGQGARFWPISRTRKPKQFLALGSNDESLIRSTVRRVRPLAGGRGMCVVTAEALAELVREHVPECALILEPFGRNTAASIGLAAVHAQREDPDAVMVVMPADHAVQDEKKLLETLREAVQLASTRDLLVTIGVTPVTPHTGYGYIQRGARITGKSFAVKRFFEKPNLERAVKYQKSEEFYWNSGMFVWRARVILQAISQFMPGLYDGLMRILANIGSASERVTVEAVFNEIESTSIDFGVLELARNCAVVEAAALGWSDVGSWDAWAEHFSLDQDKNLLHGDAIVIDSHSCIVHGQRDGAIQSERMIALLGVDNMVVIDCGDAVLICPRERVQDVKLIVDALKTSGRTELI